MAYEINYNDERFQQVESEKNAALNEVDVTYGNMIGESDKYYQAQIDASKEWADKQSQLQQEKTDFAIQEIEQQKEQEQKDYIKEQSGAYVDWQKESNKYGATAEQQAAVGLTNTGYSESSQVSMFNTYQNRVAVGREAYTLAVQNFNNAITEARVQNNSILAEIAYEALQKQLELSLQGFQHKNQLVLEQANKKTELEQMYHERWQDVLDQINHENALAEQIRQFNASLALQQAQLAEEQRQFNAQMAAKSSNSSSSVTKSSSSGSSKKTTSESYRDAQINKLSGNSSSSAPSNSKSAAALGFGPINANELNRLIATGQVSASTNNNGKIEYTRNW